MYVLTTIELLRILTFSGIDAKLRGAYNEDSTLPIQTYMTDESSREPRPLAQALRQILVWVVFCAMAAGVILGTLALVKC